MALHAASRGELSGSQEGGHESIAGERLGFLEDFVGDDVQGDLALGLACLGGKVLLRGDDRLAAIVAELERRVEVSLGNLLGRTLEHDDVLLVTDIDEVEIALSLLGMDPTLSIVLKHT